MNAPDSHPEAPRIMHIDEATGPDQTGLAIVEPPEEPPPVEQSPFEKLTNVYAAALLRTGRIDEGQLAWRCASALTCATSLGYPEPLFPGTSHITAKSLRKQRKRIMQWVRANRPALVEQAKRMAGGGE